jgi:hypothetical protein
VADGARNRGDLVTRDVVTGRVPHDTPDHSPAVRGEVKDLKGIAIAGKNGAQTMLGSELRQHRAV